MYCVHIVLAGSKLVKGVRALVHQIASKSGGFYPRERDKSIYYSGNDLIVNVLYSTRAKCLVFANELDNNLRYYALLKQENIHIDDHFDEIRLTQPPRGIL